MIRIAVLAVGNELLDGRVSDTNTTSIAAGLRSIGLNLDESRCAPDRPETIARHLRELAAGYEVLIVGGGLGPTDDDLTARAAAEAFSLPLETSTAAEKMIAAYFARTGRHMHAANHKQALLPQGAIPLPNPLGSAPGFTLMCKGCRVYFLPGVPREMQAMLEESLLPELAASFPATPRQRKTFKVLGIAEAHLQEMLHRVELPAGLDLLFTLDYPLVLITLEASGDAGKAALGKSCEEIRSVLGAALVAEDTETLPEVIARLLTSSGKTLSVAESCTGGLVSALLTDIPGASRFLERSAVTYANSAKQDWLEVPEGLLVEHGAVSSEVARAMAKGMRRAANSDLALAITGIAGPEGGTAEKPVGTVFTALATAGGCVCQRLQLQGTRDLIRRAASFRALDTVRRHLLDLPYDI